MSQDSHTLGSPGPPWILGVSTSSTSHAATFVLHPSIPSPKAEAAWPGRRRTYSWSQSGWEVSRARRLVPTLENL